MGTLDLVITVIGAEISYWPNLRKSLTAYGDAETTRKALEGGAQGLFTKPLDFGALRSEIDTRVERAA
jgi:hypothetical protein